MIATRIAPYISSRYSAKSRRISGIPTRNTAPITTPGMLPIPPRMIAASTVIETRSSKLSGVTTERLTAKNAPERHPTAAPMAKARSLYLMTLIPMASATSSSSRMAAQARPTREYWSRHDTNTARSENTRIT
jgi:hypothetical protein